MTRARWSLCLLLIFASALALRLAYWRLAPGAPTGDDLFYAAYAEAIFAGRGYVELDGSPAAFWMPGWPLLLAGWFGLFGPDPQRAMLFCVVLGSATAVLIALLGDTLAGRRVGALAGGVYALWPGAIYFTATLLSEPAFCFLQAAALVLLAIAARDGGGRRGAALSLAAGAALGLCALTKAEPLVLLPVFALAIAVGGGAPRERVRNLVLVVLGVVLLLGPWVARNRIVLDRWMLTSVSGGTNFWIGNHPGGSGGNDLLFEVAFRLANPGATLLESNLRMSASGWRQGLRFVTSQPREALAIVPRKLALTYGSDHAATANLTGIPALRGPDRRRGPVRPVAAATRALLEHTADAWWFGVLGLGALGVLVLPRLSAPAQVIVLGALASWLAVHVVFLGGPRFHAPETLVLALLAALGIERLLFRPAEARSGGRLESPG